jgi:hypothetical protein
LAGRHDVFYREKADLIFHEDESLPHHPNGMRFTAFDTLGTELIFATFYSVGGGFIVSVAGHDHPRPGRRHQFQRRRRRKSSPERDLRGPAGHLPAQRGFTDAERHSIYLHPQRHRHRSAERVGQRQHQHPRQSS